MQVDKLTVKNAIYAHLMLYLSILEVEFVIVGSYLGQGRSRKLYLNTPLLIMISQIWQ